MFCFVLFCFVCFWHRLHDSKKDTQQYLGGSRETKLRGSVHLELVPNLMCVTQGENVSFIEGIKHLFDNKLLHWLKTKFIFNTHAFELDGLIKRFLFIIDYQQRLSWRVQFVLAVQNKMH